MSLIDEDNDDDRGFPFSISISHTVIWVIGLTAVLVLLSLLIAKGSRPNSKSEVLRSDYEPYDYEDADQAKAENLQLNSTSLLNTDSQDIKPSLDDVGTVNVHDLIMRKRFEELQYILEQLGRSEDNDNSLEVNNE